jgi:hypothetical protein
LKESDKLNDIDEDKWWSAKTNLSIGAMTFSRMTK